MSRIRDALASLDAAGVRYAIRFGPDCIDEPGPGDDIDVVVSSAQLDCAEQVFVAAGFRRLRERGHNGHRFYVDCDAAGRWTKVDVMSRLDYGDHRLDAEPLLTQRERVDGVWAASASHRARHAELRAAGLRQPVTAREKLARHLPVGLRRRGAVIAVLGPDGAGKGSVIAALTASLPVARTVVYFGHRAGGGDPVARPSRPAAPAWRETLFILRRSASAWRRLVRAYAAAWRGHVVLCDRHPLDVVAVRPRRAPTAAALEQLVLGRLTPRPDAVITLDAPGEELFRRKHEHDAMTLERWRQGYLVVTAASRGWVVSTAGSEDATAANVSRIIWQAFARRNGWPRCEKAG